MPKRTFALFLTHGPNWDEARPVRQQNHWDDHAAFMDALFASGFVRLGGPFGDGSGTLVIAEAGSADEGWATFARDPWAIHQILLLRQVKPWELFLDRHR